MQPTGLTRSGSMRRRNRLATDTERGPLRADAGNRDAAQQVGRPRRCRVPGRPAWVQRKQRDATAALPCPAAPQTCKLLRACQPRVPSVAKRAVRRPAAFPPFAAITYHWLKTLRLGAAARRTRAMGMRRCALDGTALPSALISCGLSKYWT